MKKPSKPWYKKWWAITLFIFLTLIIIGSLSDSEDSSNSKNGLTPSTENETKNRCEDVPDSIAQRLIFGLNTDGITLRNVKVVKSKDFESVYFISGDLQGPGLEGENDIATFATNRLDNSGLFFSVNYVAEEFSDWPLGSKTDFNLSMNDDGAQESKDCVN
ncbi:hypothetical protein [Cyclobacterium marinum]|uniref:Uncharacterized protein n=1 Tax=Cyclobacterium marinum (strain ATCC 25205 / DSM 745 / LMG 13164 / NCIMB 1802) TaxID=880070 RepID=G0J6X7_CYCMS|nr:hypothetical protein [Cyclobacterium marinum]AEL26868.1 hypothetical protein Cycma_3140 [Cyclobacterium marinum DSM 745]